MERRVNRKAVFKMKYLKSISGLDRRGRVGIQVICERTGVKAAIVRNS